MNDNMEKALNKLLKKMRKLEYNCGKVQGNVLSLTIISSLFGWMTISKLHDMEKEIDAIKKELNTAKFKAEGKKEE